MASDATNSTGPRGELNEKFAPYKISPVLLEDFPAGETRKVILEVNLDFHLGVATAKTLLEKAVEDITGRSNNPMQSRYYVFASMTRAEIFELLYDDEVQSRGQKALQKLFKIWPDQALGSFSQQSIRTIKAEACVRSFGGEGKGIVWAVLDSGIDGNHPHFATHKNLGLPPSAGATAEDQWVHAKHLSFTGDDDPLTDEYGHGTHVAGIIAGITPPPIKPSSRRSQRPDDRLEAYKLVHRRPDNRVRILPEQMTEPMSGVATLCRLVSLKVLDANGAGNESALLAALDYIATINGDGRRIRIHGVNISIGYEFNAEWFAAGQSPVCVAVNRLVRTGVVVVAAAGNSGSARISPEGAQSGALKRVGLDQSIADPGNAEMAITVGSTHADAPHTFGVSYFSSRGPTTDGRNKPDLVAPGERIVSCASAHSVTKVMQDALFEDDTFKYDPGAAYYRDDTGTSMAAPHVSGAAAAFLSIHGEFIGQPERVKEIFVNSATDLKRKREFQGAGLLDLLRAVQSV